jgi:hypothetical protein
LRSRRFMASHHPQKREEMYKVEEEFQAFSLYN